MADFEHLDARDGAAFLLGIAPARHQDAAEAELAGLPQAQLRLRDHAHLAREPDLAEHRHVFRHRPVGEGADQRQGDREVGRRLADPQAAGDVEIDLVAGERQPAAGLQHRQQHGEAAASQPTTARRGVASGEGDDQRLDLHQHRPRALDAGEHGGAGDAAAPLRQEQGGGVGHLLQAALGHLEHADLVGRAEAVLDRAQDAELVAALALEIEHGVDHVLEHARAGDLAVLGDVADQHQDEAALLGEADQLGRGAAHLRDGAGRGIEVVEIHGLDRIDHHQVGRVGRGRGWR